MYILPLSMYIYYMYIYIFIVVAHNKHAEIAIRMRNVHRYLVAT